jgi:hypothetical protein
MFVKLEDKKLIDVAPAVEILIKGPFRFRPLTVDCSNVIAPLSFTTINGNRTVT